MADRNEHELRDTSDDLMASLNELKDLEAQKREQDISTPRFHRLADVVEEQARKVFDIASTETAIGEKTGPTTDHSIDEVEPSR